MTEWERKNIWKCCSMLPFLTLSPPYHWCLIMIKMTWGTPAARSDKRLTLLTFDIWFLTFDIWHFRLYIQLMDQGPMDQWTNGPMDQWTSGPMDQWTNGPMDMKFFRPYEKKNTLEYWNIGTLEHCNIWTFDIQLASCYINCIDFCNKKVCILLIPSANGIIPHCLKWL